MGFKDSASAAIKARAAARAGIAIGGVFKLRHIRDGKVIHEEEQHNIWVDEGLDEVLEVITKVGTTPTLYVGLKDDAAAPAAGHTAAQIGGTNTWDNITVYAAGVRPTYTSGTASSKSIDNVGNEASYSINGTDTVGGAFLIDDSTKAGTAGTLFCAVDFSSARAVQSGDTLEVTYTLTSADDGV
jgi:hypothetical protein